MNDFLSNPWVVRGIIVIAVAVLGRVFGPMIRDRMDRSAKSWPQTSGRVEHTRATVVNNGNGDRLVGEVSYSYSANGDYYAGFLHFPARTEEQAERLAGAWKGLPLIVRYKANDPEVSHIIFDEQPPRAPLGA